MALNNICEIPTGLAEVVTSGMVPTMVNALDVDELWFYALVVLDNAKSNEIAIFTMLGEGILAKLAGRSSVNTPTTPLNLHDGLPVPWRCSAQFFLVVVDATPCDDRHPDHARLTGANVRHCALASFFRRARTSLSFSS